MGWRDTANNTGSVDLALNPAYSEGDGAASLGRELAHTDAFSSCQVKKAFRAVCLREPMDTPTESAAMSDFVGVFNAGGNIKQVFAEVAGYCAAHL